MSLLLRLHIIFFVLIGVLNIEYFVNGECVDRPQLFLHKRGIRKELVGGGDTPEPIVVLSDVSREYLSCRSSRNVQWSYVGEGTPSKLMETAEVDIKTDPNDETLQYCITSRISFYHKQSDTDLSKHTGRYVCQEIGNVTNKVQAYVYVGRRNAPVFLHSRKVLRIPLSQDNLTDVSFTVPCATSTPSINVTLLKRQLSGGNAGNKFQVFVNPAKSLDGEGVKFDPRTGFRVDTTGRDITEYYGEYKCVSKVISSKEKVSQDELRTSGNSDEDFVIYNLFKPPSFKATPPSREVFTSGILNLTCESSDESVILKEVKLKGPGGMDDYLYDERDEEDSASDSQEADDIVETLENTEQKNHVANYIETNPLPGSFGEFKCLTEKDGRVLHVWKYRILDKKEEKMSGIKFNKRDNSFSCRTKTGMPGQLSFVSCRTPSECAVNRICLEKSENCRGYSNATKALCHRGNHFCGKIFYKGGSGLIRCLGEGIDQIRGFTDEANDEKLRMGFHKLKPSETVLLRAAAPTSISQAQETNVSSPTTKSRKKEFSEGDEVVINLKLGHYYFVYPMQWAIKLSNGSSLHIAPESEVLHKSKLHRTVEAKIKLPFMSTEAKMKDGGEKGDGVSSSSSQIVGINALIPLRSSVDPSWKTITLPLQVNRKISPEKKNSLEESANAVPTARSDIQFESDGVTEVSLQEVNTEDFKVEFVTEQQVADAGGNNNPDLADGDLVEESEAESPTTYKSTQES